MITRKLVQSKSSQGGKARMPLGEKDIRSVFTLLAIQCMIRLGQIPDPVTHESRVDMKGARLYFGLLQVLEEKTRGNLDEAETNQLREMLDNLAVLLEQKGNEKNS